MKLLILEVFDRENLQIHNPWYLYNKFRPNNYNYIHIHKHNYIFIFINSFFSIYQLISIRRKMIKSC